MEELTVDCHTLYTYINLDELRKIQEEMKVFTFIFGKTKEMIDTCPKVCIDISALVYFLQYNRNDSQLVYANFEGMTEETVIIAEKATAESALELLPFLVFNDDSYFSDGDKSSKQEMVPYSKPYQRQKIYKYNNAVNLDQIIQYSTEHNIPIATFSQVNDELKSEFEQFNRSEEMSLMDLTSASYVIENNKAMIYAMEVILNSLPNIKVIAQTSQVDVLLKYFPLFFDGQEPVCKLLPTLSGLGMEDSNARKLIKITDLSGTSFDTFIDTLNHNLIGHRFFKERLQYVLNNFILLNKAKDQKVFSIFLFGASGIGKTEVARLIANGLQDDCYLAKINFQNYSSQDALNSLIGSPAGYFGCNNGELSEKIQKSKVGVLLCDEFEKTTRPVFSFFLELLEEGQFTDSMAREYNMDGYIIIFTSNLINEAEYKKAIPPELQTRFDLVCEFENPTIEEKTEFLDLLLEMAKSKYIEQFSDNNMTEKEKKKLYNFDYDSLSSLRDIKRVFNNRLMDFFKEKKFSKNK